MKSMPDMYLSDEVKQAWEHYRHLEEMRTKYLAFYATIILTSSGFLVTLTKNTDTNMLNDTRLIPSLSVFTFLLLIFSYSIWANITRVGFILGAYEVILSETRKHMLGAESAGYRLWKIRDRIPPAISSGIFRIQMAASAIVLSVCVLLISAEIYMSYLVLSGTARGSVWQGYVIGVFAILMFALVTYGFIRFRQALKYQAPNVSLSNSAIYEIESDTDVRQLRREVELLREQITLYVGVIDDLRSERDRLLKLLGERLEALSAYKRNAPPPR